MCFCGGLNATMAAVEEGNVPGGGVALLYASKELEKLQTANFDQKIGVQIIQNALKSPVYTIASNAGVEGAVVVGKLLEQDNPDLGYDAAKGEYVDMVKLIWSRRTSVSCIKKYFWSFARHTQRPTRVQSQQPQNFLFLDWTAFPAAKREWWVRVVPAYFAPNLDPHLSRPQFLRRSSRNRRRISHNPRRRRTILPNSPPMGEGSQSQSGSYTVDAALVSMGFGRFQAFVLAYAGMGWISEAMEVMLLSFIGPSMQLEWNLSSREESLITSVVFAGMLIGAYSWGIVSDNHGRRMGFLFTALVTSGAGFLSSFAPNYITLIVLRFVVGIGLGGGPVLASWFLEFIPVPNRGTWMVVFSSFWTLGTILEASLAWVVMPTFGWRWLLALSSLPSFLLLLCYSLTPESPRYLCMKGRKTEAVNILEKIARMNNVDVPSGILVSDHEVELEEISNPSEDTHLISVPKNKVTISEDVESSIGGITALLKLLQPKLLRSTLLLWMVFFGNAFSYYGIVLLTSELNNGNRKCTSKESLLRNSADNSLYKDVLITSFAEVPGLLLSAAIVDRIGRKLSMSAMLFISSMFLIPLVFNQTEVLTTTLLFGARTCISGSFTIVYIYAPEIYPTSVRSTGVGIASSVARIGGIICPLVAVGLVHGCHQTTALLLFNLVLILSGLAVCFFPFETSGRGLSDTVQS